jgi:hypothetical protein
MRLMSFSKTTPQFIAGTKLVTRRVRWLHAKVGMQVMGVEKAMGLKPGEKIVRLRPIEFTDVRREPLRRMIDDLDYGRRECILEGFPPPHEKSVPYTFVRFFCDFSGLSADDDVTRIEYRFID